jgi:hypothetical protein
MAAGAFCTSTLRSIRPAKWVAQQLREAFPLLCPYECVLFDHDARFGHEVLNFLKSGDFRPIHTSVRTAWQSGTAERWVSSASLSITDTRCSMFVTAITGRHYLEDFAVAIVHSCALPQLFTALKTLARFLLI